MNRCRLFVVSSAILAYAGAFARGQDPPSSGAANSSSPAAQSPGADEQRPSPRRIPAAVAPVPWWLYYPSFTSYSIGGPYPFAYSYSSPFISHSIVINGPSANYMLQPPGFGMAGPMMPLGPVNPIVNAPIVNVPVTPRLEAPRAAAPRIGPGAAVDRPRIAAQQRANELVKIGDRLFRAGNLNRAVERYEQAVRAAPNQAEPRLHLAQVALVRGKYSEAATLIREAQSAEPGWLLNAGDIQSIYAEPGDFNRQIAKIESHVQANPNDRDAWFVLGAQLYLSGRTRRAGDVFLRLTDREPDAALSAFLAAARPGR